MFSILALLYKLIQTASHAAYHDVHSFLHSCGPFSMQSGNEFSWIAGSLLFRLSSVWFSVLQELYM